MPIIALKNLKCSFDVQHGDFAIDWDVQNDYDGGVLTNVVICETSETTGSAAQFDENNLRFVNVNLHRTHIMPDGKSNQLLRRFIVVGVIGIEQPRIEEIRNRVAEMKTSDICVTGFCARGKVTWSVARHQNNANIVINSDIDIPIGFLTYSFPYGGKRFVYPVLKPITVGESRKTSISFLLPDKVKPEDVRLEAVGTAIQCVNEKDTGKLFSKIMSIIKQMFG